MELLIRVTDKEGSPLLGKRGYVVVCCPDGWDWSPEERTNPDWRILTVPALPDDEAVAFTTPEIGDLTTFVLRKRGLIINIDALPAGIRNQIAAPRTGRGITIPLDALRAARVVNPPLPRADVLGPSSTSLGPGLGPNQAGGR